MFVPVLVMVAVLIARWILVIGYGDFGTDYDFVSRLMQDQWQGLDFFAVYPPLSGYSLLLFMRMLGDHYIVVNIHLWFWWMANAAVAAGLVLAYRGSIPKAAMVAAAVALLTVPANTSGASFELMASALSGMSAVLFLWHFKTGKRSLAALAGACGGICTFVKPNVGVSIVASMVVVSFALAVLQRRAGRTFARAGLLVLLGAGAGAILSIAIPGFYGGYGELAKQIFIGGPEIKGGVYALVLRSIPRISTTLTGPRRFVIEAALTIPLLAGLAMLFGRSFQFGDKTRTPVRNETSEARRLLWLVCGVAVVLSAWSLLPWELPHRLTVMTYEWQIVSLPFFLWQILYVIAVVGLTVSIIARILHRQVVQGQVAGDGADAVSFPLWAAVLGLVWTVGVVASARHNSIFASTLFVPALALQFGEGHERAFYRAAAVFLIGWTLAWHVAPNWQSTFAHLTRLPMDSKFSGLYWPDGGASVPGSYPYWASSHMIEALQRNVSPRVRGKSILWLVPGPGAAFGGRIYAYGVDGLAPNNVPLFAEKRFGENVRHNPPDFIVSSTFSDWKDPKWTFMRPGVIGPWLRAHYRLVWTLTDNPAPLVLWQRR